MSTNPSDADRSFDLLGRWGFTRAGWADNRHGEWWLLAQLALIAADLLLPSWPAPEVLGLAWPGLVVALGWLLLLAGLVLAAQAFWRLGPSLTPLPEPMPGAPLVTEGAYGRCRHPLYQALLLAALGQALRLGSPLHLVLLLALAAVLASKARREERALCLAHADYPAYRAVTPAIVPRLPGLDWR